MASTAQWAIFMVASMLAMFVLYKIIAARQERKRNRDKFHSLFGDWD